MTMSTTDESGENAGAVGGSKNEGTEDVDVGSLENEAKRRKERLKAMRQKLLGGEEKEGTTSTSKGGLPKPMFRSYNPSDEKLQEASVPKVKPVEIEALIEDTLEQGKVKTLVEDVDIVNLAPRKPDWDLKRDVAPKLNELERRTQKAIAELIMERLKLSQSDGLAAAVQLSSPQHRNVEDQDED